VLAYVFGIMGTRRLGASTASVVALLEVVCAVLSAWWLLGQTVSLTQIAGGAAILAGAAVVQSRRSVPPSPELVPVASTMA